MTRSFQPALQPALLREPAPDVINFRVVVNDAVCRPWEPMPEIHPPTLTGLIGYLEGECGINPHPLAPESTFDRSGYYYSYGLRKQFRIPTAPTEAELSRLEEWNSPGKCLCPVCGSEIHMDDSRYDGTDAYWEAVCEPCGLRFSRARPALSPIDLATACRLAFARRPDLECGR